MVFSAHSLIRVTGNGKDKLKKRKKSAKMADPTARPRGNARRREMDQFVFHYQLLGTHYHL